MATDATVVPCHPLPGHPEVAMTFVIERDPGDEWTRPHLTVWPTFTGVDRPRGVGMAVKDMAMARRLIAASLAGKAMTVDDIRVDGEGKTYVGTSWKVLSRMLSADLHRLGY